MTRITVVPEPWAIFNEFDRHGLLLSLPRIRRERNSEYKQRLMDVFVNRANSTYRGLINGITRELGLSIIDVMSVVPVKDINGNTLLTNPAIEFIETKCKLYNDFMENDILLEIDRFEKSSGAWTLEELVNVINGTGYFIATLLDEVEEQKRSMTIFNQSSFEQIFNEDISGSGSVVVLKHNNIIEGSVSVNSPNLKRFVSTEAELTFDGAYTIRYKQGVLVVKGVPAPGSYIRYIYRNDDFTVQASPVILHNLQSDDFKTKMFENIAEDSLGLPTVLGAEIINELLSVYPTNWGI